MEENNPQLKNSPRRRSRQLQAVRNPKPLRHAPRPVRVQTGFELTVESEEEEAADAKYRYKVLPHLRIV